MPYGTSLQDHLNQLDADARQLKARRGYVKDFGRLFGFADLTDDDVSDADAAKVEVLLRSIADRLALRRQVEQTVADARQQVPEWIKRMPNVRVG